MRYIPTRLRWMGGVAGAVLLLTSCAPVLTQLPLAAPAEEDLVLAEELEQKIGEEEDSILTEAGGAGSVFVPQPQPLASIPLSLTEAATPLSAGGSLAIPTAFAVTRPEKELKTSYASYFITGTSDPNQPVYFGGEEIQRQGTKGVFGVHAPLEMGTNTFTFSQGGESQRVTIIRTAPPGTAKINAITQSSMVPAFSAGVKAGEKLSVGCVAPAGATVTASFGGQSVVLKQAKEDLKAGLPAAFTGKIPVEGNGVPADETQKAGPVEYTLHYQGGSKTYTSSGVVCVAGRDSAIAVEITSYMGFIYPDVKNLSSFKETVKAGARDYVVGQSNDYFELRSGGYISKEQAGIVLGKVGVKNSLKDASFSQGGKAERIIFHGARSPIYDAWTKDNVFYLRLYNTSGAPRPSVSGSSLVSSCSVEEGEGFVTYQFPLSGRLWGYDVSFEGGDTTLSLRHKPRISGGSLSGVTVVLDPGHGGEDCGALGLAGRTGPTEADVNLANALVTQDLLTRMGAKVVMTRDRDAAISLDDRMQVIEDSGADIFVSLHHNSVGEDADANKISGMEVYYHTALSKSFASSMMGSLAANLNRNNRSVNQSYYRVTLMHHSPSLLVELGFMSNPLEYEKAAGAAEMEKVANAVYNGIVAALQ